MSVDLGVVTNGFVGVDEAGGGGYGPEVGVVLGKKRSIALKGDAVRALGRECWKQRISPRR